MPRIRSQQISKEGARARFAWGLLWFGLLLIVIRTINVHLFPDDRIMRQAQNQYWAQVSYSATRGDVRDRSGIPLAISVPSVSFFIDPKHWDPLNAPLLEPYFGPAAAEAASRAISGRFQWVGRKMPLDLAEVVRAQKIPGLYSMTESQRMYPHGELASHVIGFCDIDGNGLSGIERQWNDILYSPVQTRMLMRDARGGLLDMIGSNADSTIGGAGSLQLTIDSKLQQIVEWKLKEGAESTGSKWGVGVCVDPRTGEILAMASYPWIDLNDRKQFSKPEFLRNNAIGRVYEPGSTFKPIMLAMAMEMGTVAKNDHFYCSGKVNIADGVIRDVSAHGSIGTDGLLIKSCNTGMAIIGQKLNSHKAYGMLKQFGFGIASDVEITGEEAGLLRMPEEWLGTSKANIAIGQGLAVTPLQLVMGISAIANGGELLKPYVVSEVANAAGTIVHRGERRVRNAVLSPQTCDYIKKVLKSTVETGTGKGAKVAGISLAGKTGTAQIAAGGEYAKGQYVSSFIGFWPAEEPDHVMLIALGEPSGGRYYGGEIAAPVFRAILEDISHITSVGNWSLQ